MTFSQKIFQQQITSYLWPWFIFSSTCHNYETSFATKGLMIPTITTTKYGKGTFTIATTTRNNIKSEIKDPMINIFSPNTLTHVFSLISIRIFIKPKVLLLLVAYKYGKNQFGQLFLFWSPKKITSFSTNPSISG